MFAASHGQARYNLPAYVLRATPGCHHRRLKPLQCTPNIDDLLGDIEAPDIAADIQSMQEKLGAVFEVGFYDSHMSHTRALHHLPTGKHTQCC